MGFLGFPAVFLSLSPLLCFPFSLRRQEDSLGHLITVLMAGRLADHRWSLLWRRAPHVVIKITGRGVSHLDGLVKIAIMTEYK